MGVLIKMSTVKEILELNRGIFKKKTAEILCLRAELNLMEAEVEKWRTREAQRIKLAEKKKALKIKAREKREARKCKASCQSCETRVTPETVISQKTKEVIDVNPNLTCNSEMVVYLVSCKRCPWRYIGKTTRGVRIRSQGHR